MSPLALAFVGDAVLELLVRQRLVETTRLPPGKLHSTATHYVSAHAQHLELALVEPLLTEEELRAYKRGRDANPHAHPKGATRQEYQIATGLEALFGWLYLQGETDRLNELFAHMMEGGD